MHIQLQPLTPFQGSHWQVQLDQLFVTFRNESEARHFVDRLEARLAAPHPLPGPDGAAKQDAGDARS
ncbi:hypothetical protein [Stutzerimonas azotifigens]|uniref:hypothetical protein n=1 Tax=Stutzerimonas azotifigens TaxID=291995 RepID=UPI000403F92C|nr:hypothetical protein [Stutzerimonas azotifigens]